MRLPHHPERIGALPVPTTTDPWRVLVSGCIFGLACGVDGTDYGMSNAMPTWLRDPRVRLFPFCPEDAGLGTPRSMPDFVDGDGFDVLEGNARVSGTEGKDLTREMIAGAEAMVRFARAQSVHFAVLTDRSAACGSQVISLGNRFEPPVRYRLGVGVATAALLRAGVDVVSQRDFTTLERLHSRLDPQYVPDLGRPDHHNHPWVLENL